MRISNKNLVTNILVSVAVAIISFALLNTLNQSPQNWDPAAFLLGVCGLAASISGIGFALYGYYNTNRAEKIVEEKLKVKFNEYEKIMNERNLRMQEALQKMLSGYSVHHIEKDPDRAIELYKSAVELYPEIYNGYNALAYAYWYDKKDFMKAKEYFELALKTNPHSYQTLNDLARFSAEMKEHSSTYQYLKETLKIKPDAYKDIENDPIFADFKKAHPDYFYELIENAKAKQK